jgi:hypothetical protein
MGGDSMAIQAGPKKFVAIQEGDQPFLIASQDMKGVHTTFVVKPK